MALGTGEANNARALPRRLPAKSNALGKAPSTA